MVRLHTIGGGRLTLANQSYITCHGGHASKILSRVRGGKQAETLQTAY